MGSALSRQCFPTLVLVNCHPFTCETHVIRVLTTGTHLVLPEFATFKCSKGFFYCGSTKCQSRKGIKLQTCKMCLLHKLPIGCESVGFCSISCTKMQGHGWYRWKRHQLCRSSFAVHCYKHFSEGSKTREMFHNLSQHPPSLLNSTCPLPHCLSADALHFATNAVWL